MIYTFPGGHFKKSPGRVQNFTAKQSHRTTLIFFCILRPQRCWPKDIHALAKPLEFNHIKKTMLIDTFTWWHFRISYLGSQGKRGHSGHKFNLFSLNCSNPTKIRLSGLPGHPDIGSLKDGYKNYDNRVHNWVFILQKRKMKAD